MPRPSRQEKVNAAGRLYNSGVRDYAAIAVHIDVDTPETARRYVNEYLSRQARTAPAAPPSADPAAVLAAVTSFPVLPEVTTARPYDAAAVAERVRTLLPEYDHYKPLAEPLPEFEALTEVLIGPDLRNLVELGWDEWGTTGAARVGQLRKTNAVGVDVCTVYRHNAGDSENPEIAYPDPSTLQCFEYQVPDINASVRRADNKVFGYLLAWSWDEAVQALLQVNPERHPGTGDVTGFNSKMFRFEHEFDTLRHYWARNDDDDRDYDFYELDYQHKTDPLECSVVQYATAIRGTGPDVVEEEIVASRGCWVREIS